MKTRIAPRLYALASAALFTLVLLGAVNGLATSAPGATQLARAAASQQA